MFFPKSPCKMRITPLSDAPISTPRYTNCVPAYAAVQFCFKSSALISCQCGRKTQYWLEFWSLDLPSAQVHVFGPSPSTTVRRDFFDQFKKHYFLEEWVISFLSCQWKEYSLCTNIITFYQKQIFKFLTSWIHSLGMLKTGLQVNLFNTDSITLF